MQRKTGDIPINQMANEFGEGIAIERVSFTNPGILVEGEQSHRHDGHSFFLLEKGTIDLEIDFRNYTITAPAVIYVHPDQVHRTKSTSDITVSSWSVTNDNLNAEYLAILEDITPAKPLLLSEEPFALIFEAASLSIKFSKRKNNKLYHSLLKESCNALVALVITEYLTDTKPADKPSRFEIVTKNFRRLLEKHYTLLKGPAAYAQKLNISTPYLNECVKKATGYPVSHHIQQRVILEAKRLLCYSAKSVKEIAAELAYDDYPYFSRLFTKATGMTALAFRTKNRG